MSYGSNEAVENAEDDCCDDCADLIAQKAAELVAAGDMGRDDAIDAAANWLRQENEAESDETGVARVECKDLKASKESPPHQVAAIKAELLEGAEAAADSISQSH